MSLQNNQRLSGLCADVTGYKNVNVYNLHAHDSLQRPSRRSHTPPCTPATSIASTSTGITTSPDGESLDSWATSNNLGLLYNLKETASFFSRRWNVGTNPDLAFASLGQDSRLPDRHVLGKFPRSQHRDFHLRTHQILRGDTRIFARAYFLRLNNVSHVAVGRTICHAGTKSARPSIAPLSEPQWWLPLTEPPHPYSLDYNRRSRSDGRKLSNPSTSRTPAARRGEHSINLLAGLGTPLVFAPAQKIPLPRNSWRTGHAKLVAASPPGCSTNSCPTYGRFQHLRVTVSPIPSGWKSLLLPSDAWSQESLRDWIRSSRSLYSTLGRLSHLGFATSSLPACANSKLQRSGEQH